jgi:hypothetical protein
MELEIPTRGMVAGQVVASSNEVGVHNVFGV